MSSLLLSVSLDQVRPFCFILTPAYSSTSEMRIGPGRTDQSITDQVTLLACSRNR